MSDVNFSEIVNKANDTQTLIFYTAILLIAMTVQGLIYSDRLDKLTEEKKQIELSCNKE